MSVRKGGYCAGHPLHQSIVVGVTLFLHTKEVREEGRLIQPGGLCPA